MNEAQALFREGVLALRERRDADEARRLLMESLRHDPKNEMAWLWLARTISDPDKRLQCVERALSINPANEKALEFKAQILSLNSTAAFEQVSPAKPRNSANRKLTTDEEKRIRILLKKADDFIEKGDPESAIEQWVDILDIQVDHELAMRNAVGYLSRMKYIDDARELIHRAIDAGTQHPSIYLTAIDIAKHKGDFGEMEALTEKLVTLPEVDESIIVSVIERFMKDEQVARAVDVLTTVLEQRPRSQKLLTLMGDALHLLDREAEALRYYDRAARLGSTTREGREADKKLLQHAPLLSDRERGSMLLAWREAAGFAVIFIILGWQDAGLDLMNLGLERWLGVLLSLVGGYLLITATSSPQQKPLAAWLGGQIMEKRKRDEDDLPGLNDDEEESALPLLPAAARLALGAAGAALLVVAFTLVFSSALNLIANPVAPIDIPTIDELMAGRLH